MENYRPHHSRVCRTVFHEDGHFILIPELWSGVDDQALLQQFDDQGLAVATDGQPIRKDSDLIIKDRKIFKILDSFGLLSYTIFSDEKYLSDLPVFFGDEWDPEISTESMIFLGWTVNKFTEPAFLFGFFPIQSISNKKDTIGRNDIIGQASTIDGEKIFGYEILDKKVINKWGLISKHDDALRIANTNTIHDPEGEIWRSLALYVDELTMEKLEGY